MKTSHFLKHAFFIKIIPAGIFILGLMNTQVTHGQVWPVNFDGAQALKPAQLELSLYGSGSYLSYLSSDYDGGTLGYTPGFRAGIGIVNNFDVKLSYSRGFYKFSKLEDSKQNVIGIAPKVAFLKEHLAFQLPFNVILFNSEYEGSKLEAMYMLNPRIILSFHYQQYVEFNIAPSCQIFIPGHDVDPSYMIGGNLGFAFSSNLQKWSVRPEGFIYYLIPRGENYKELMYGWGLSFTYNIDFVKSKQEAPAE
jgi:hypothetical protein